MLQRGDETNLSIAVGVGMSLFCVTCAQFCQCSIRFISDFVVVSHSSTAKEFAGVRCKLHAGKEWRATSHNSKTHAGISCWCSLVEFEFPAQELHCELLDEDHFAQSCEFLTKILSVLQGVMLCRVCCDSGARLDVFPNLGSWHWGQSCGAFSVIKWPQLWSFFANKKWPQCHETQCSVWVVWGWMFFRNLVVVLCHVAGAVFARK